MRSSNCQPKEQERQSIANQHKGLLRLPVFKENNQIANQQPVVDMSKNRKKQEFESKMKRFI